MALIGPAAEVIKASLSMIENSRNFCPTGGVIVAEARDFPEPGSHDPRLSGSPHCHFEPAGSMIICPNTPFGCWNIGSDENRFSEPNSTGAQFNVPLEPRSIVPGYH